MNKYEQRVRDLEGAFVDQGAGRQPIPATDLDIDAVERKIGAALPPDYREFLRNYGLISFISVMVPVQATGAPWAQNPPGEWMGVGVLYSATPDDAYGLLENYFTYQEFEQRMPPELLPIADVGDGSQMCMAVADNPEGHVSYGAIYFWDRSGGTPTIPYSEDYSNVHFIAASFDEFMHLLQRDREYEKEYEGIEED